jgi:hypothetical protein
MATLRIPYPQHGWGIFYCLLTLLCSRPTDLRIIVASGLRVVPAPVRGQREPDRR